MAFDGDCRQQYPRLECPSELALYFDVEFVSVLRDGSQRVYVRTRKWEEWQHALIAVKSLYRWGMLSVESYVEGDWPHNMQQGISIAHLLENKPLDMSAVVLHERGNADLIRRELSPEPDDGSPEEVWPSGYWA